jgi:hypothetical protein
VRTNSINPYFPSGGAQMLNSEQSGFDQHRPFAERLQTVES